jgi:1-acyl-sn-glycerol-3-phosphate acyltransferase
MSIDTPALPKDEPYSAPPPSRGSEHPARAPHPLAPLLRPVLGGLYRGLVHLTVENVERIPPSGPCILAFNHQSNLDPHLIFTLMPRRDVVGLVASEYRNRAFERWIVEACGGIWLRRGVGDRAALRRALTLLEAGWLVGLAPEGGRSRDGVLRRARRGVGFLAVRSGAPLLPVAVEGTRDILRSIRCGRRAPVRVSFGEVFRPSDEDRTDVRTRSRRVADEVMARVAALLRPEMRGAYAGTPEADAASRGVE